MSELASPPKLFFTDYLDDPSQFFAELKVNSGKKMLERLETMPSFTLFVNDETRLREFFAELSKIYFHASYMLFPWYKEALSAIAEGDPKKGIEGLLFLEKISPDIYDDIFKKFIAYFPAIVQDKQEVISKLEQYILQNKHNIKIKVALDFIKVLINTDNNDNSKVDLVKNLQKLSKSSNKEREFKMIFVPPLSAFRGREEEIAGLLAQSPQKFVVKLKLHWLSEAFKKITSGNISEGVRENLQIMEMDNNYRRRNSIFLEIISVLPEQNKKAIISAWRENPEYRQVLTPYINVINGARKGIFPDMCKFSHPRQTKYSKQKKEVHSELSVADCLAKGLFARAWKIFRPHKSKVGSSQPEAAKSLIRLLKRNFPEQYNKYMEDIYSQAVKSQENKVKVNKYRAFLWCVAYDFALQKKREENEKQKQINAVCSSLKTGNFEIAKSR